ncbi:MAG: rod shape-determining protein MreC [Actinobacteria bacterium]|nr:MAG: rod shape-determining protein MreC [Actinomycetota bacterium]
MALSRRVRSTRLLVISLVMASLLVITVDYRGGTSGPFEVAGRALQTVVGTLQSGVSRVLQPIGSFFSGLVHIGSLQAQNHRLQQEIQDLREKAQHDTSLRRLIDEFNSLYKLQQTYGLQGVAATVIGQSVNNFQWSVTINRGSGDGIKQDMPVVSGDGLVGHVVSVTSNTSIVLLVLDPDSFVDGRLSSSGVTGGVQGERNKDLQMSLVPPDTKVFPGEQVVTSGYQSGLYPPEIPIGSVSHVYIQDGGLNKLITIRPAVDFSALEIVLVVTGYLAPTTRTPPPSPTPSP